MSNLPEHPDFERRTMAPLRRLGRVLKRWVLVEGLCALAAIAVGVAGLHLGIDRFLDLGIGPRVALVALVLVFVGNELRKRLLNLVTLRIGVEDVAAILERKNPELRDGLISAVAFASAPTINPNRD